jgi:hypothetical protein
MLRASFCRTLFTMDRVTFIDRVSKDNLARLQVCHVDAGFFRRVSRSCQQDLAPSGFLGLSGPSDFVIGLLAISYNGDRNALFCESCDYVRVESIISGIRHNISGIRPADEYLGHSVCRRGCSHRQSRFPSNHPLYTQSLTAQPRKSRHCRTPRSPLHEI